MERVLAKANSVVGAVTAVGGAVCLVGAGIMCIINIVRAAIWADDSD